MMVFFKSSFSRLGIRSTARTVGFLLLVVSVLTFPTLSQTGSDDPQKIARASTLIQTAKLDQAEAVLWEVLTNHPENAEALNLLGNIRMRQKRYAESETLLRR